MNNNIYKYSIYQYNDYHYNNNYSDLIFKDEIKDLKCTNNEYTLTNKEQYKQHKEKIEMYKNTINNILDKQNQKIDIGRVVNITDNLYHEMFLKEKQRRNELK